MYIFQINFQIWGCPFIFYFPLLLSINIFFCSLFSPCEFLLVTLWDHVFLLLLFWGCQLIVVFFWVTASSFVALSLLDAVFFSFLKNLFIHYMSLSFSSPTLLKKCVHTLHLPINATYKLQVEPPLIWWVHLLFSSL